MLDMFQGSGQPLSAGGFSAALGRLGVAQTQAAILWSVLAVETRGFGYLPDRRPKILFERHIFHNRTGGRFSRSNPGISNPTPGGYSGGAAEYLRLKQAMALNRQAALESASWGLGQIMGFNASAIGYAGVDAMVDAFRNGEDAQLEGCARFITAKADLKKALLERKWARVAFFYNGSTYAKNRYDTKLSSAFTDYSSQLPDIGCREGQAYLAYLGLYQETIDGVNGSRTAAALNAFNKKYEQSLSEFGTTSLAILRERVGL